MENIIKELKEEYLGEEIKLLELDRDMQSVAGDTGLVYDDIFDSCNTENIEEGSFCFLNKYDENMDWVKSINIIFDIVEKTDNVLDTVIKITDIDLI